MKMRKNSFYYREIVRPGGWSGGKGGMMGRLHHPRNFVKRSVDINRQMLKVGSFFSC